MQSDTARLDFFRKRMPLYRKDIALFAREQLQFEPDDWQLELFKYIASENRVSVKSGQGVGKTGCESIVAIWFLSCFPFSKVIATAPTRRQLNDVLWAEIDKWRSKSPVLSEILKWTKTYIYVVGNEKRWFATARTATKPENMQGFHEDNMLFIVDEASGVAEEIMEAILGTLSGQNNKLLMCGNPTKTSGTFYESHTQDRGIYSCITVNSEKSKRTNKDNIAALARKYGKDSNVYRVRVLGEFPEQEDDVFIPLSLIEQATMRDLEDQKIIRIMLGVDVARFGDDETVITENIGGRISLPTIRHGQDLMKTVGDIVITYRKLIADYPEYKGPITCNIDDTGLGGGVTDRLEEVKMEQKLTRLVVVPVNAAAAPPNDAAEHYADITTYMWATVRDLIEAGELSLQNDNELVAQLSCRKYGVSSNGRLALETKKEMKKRGISSPDRADSLALACFTKDKVYNEWAEKAASLVITEGAALAMPILEIHIGVSSVGHYGASLVAAAIVGNYRKAVVLADMQIPGHMETDAIGKEFATFAKNIWIKYKRIDNAYCDPDDFMLLKSLRVSAERKGIPVTVRPSIGEAVSERIKLTTRLIAQNRLYLVEESTLMEQALSSASWNDKKLAKVRNESPEASTLNAFEYTIEGEITRFLSSE